MGQASPSQQNPARQRVPVPRRVVAVPYHTERAIGKAEGEHPWGDKGSTVMAGLEKPLLEEGRHSRPLAATRGTGRETGPGCQQFGRAPWAQHELGQVGGCRHPCRCRGPPRGAQDPAGAVAFSRPPGSGKTGGKREACFAGEFFFVWHILWRCRPGVVQLGMDQGLVFALHNRSLSLSSPDHHARRCDGRRPVLTGGSGPLLGAGRQDLPPPAAVASVPQAPEPPAAAPRDLLATLPTADGAHPGLPRPSLRCRHTPPPPNQ